MYAKQARWRGLSLGKDMPLEDHAQHWRNCANEARTHAGQMRTEEAKRQMLEIAEGYLQLAQRAEERTAGKKAR